MPNAKVDLLRPRPLETLALLPCGTVLGILAGALMNAINTWVSPNFFGNHFPGWSYIANLELLKWSVKQGMINGLKFGVTFSFILMLRIGFISKLCCPLRLGITVQLKVIAFSFLFWIAGGLNGVLAGFLFSKFSGVAPDGLNNAWVVGSIFGVVIGSILSTIGALSSFARRWRQIEKQAQI